jgi:DUF4097 and DUF4098 domain-containing protein YvlB
VTTFDTTGHVALRVELGGGNVDVEATDEPGVEIELVPLRDNDATRKAIAEARVEMRERRGGHEVVIQVAKGPVSLIGRNPKVGVRVRCPRGSDLALRSSSADLGVTGALGAVDARTASGDVQLEDAASVHVDTASGDLCVRDVEGTLQVRTASGDVSVHHASGHLSANLVSGDLSVAGAAAGLAVTTVSGDVRIQVAGGGAMRIQSVSGDVDLGIRPGERLYIDASSVSGTMSSELGLDDVPPGDATIPVVELRARTVSGNVEIRRATSVGV